MLKWIGANIKEKPFLFIYMFSLMVCNNFLIIIIYLPHDTLDFIGWFFLAAFNLYAIYGIFSYYTGWYFKKDKYENVRRLYKESLWRYLKRMYDEIY